MLRQLLRRILPTTSAAGSAQQPDLDLDLIGSASNHGEGEQIYNSVPDLTGRFLVPSRSSQAAPVASQHPPKDRNGALLGLSMHSQSRSIPLGNALRWAGRRGTYPCRAWLQLAAKAAHSFRSRVLQAFFAAVGVIETTHVAADFGTALSRNTGSLSGL
jgi:hypothetical protein